MLKDKCTDDPLFILALQNSHNADPKHGTAKLIAGQFQSKGQTDSTIVWLEKASELALKEEAKEEEIGDGLEVVESEEELKNQKEEIEKRRAKKEEENQKEKERKRIEKLMRKFKL